MTSEEMALVPQEDQVQSLLVGTPADRVIQATAIANALAPVITEKHLYISIGGKRHVLYEGWATLGALVGVFPITAETRQYADRAWARVEARTLAGALVGAAEAVCHRTEKRWENADEYAILSMAQTRAGSKALRMPLGFIMQLAGFEGTPAEEMDGVQQSAPKGPIDEQRVAARTLLEQYIRREGGAQAVIKMLDDGELPGPLASILVVTPEPDRQLAPVLGNLSSKAMSKLIAYLKAKLGE